jgi:hypothetical protein
VAERKRLALVIKALGDRLKVFSDALVYRDFCKEVSSGDWTFTNYDPAAVAKYLRCFPNDLDILARAGKIVEEICFPAWCEDDGQRYLVKSTLDVHFRDAAKDLGIKFVVFMQTLRVAVLGKDKGMDMYDALLLLGQQRVLARLFFAIEEFIISPAWQPGWKEKVGTPFTLLLKGRSDMATTSSKRNDDATASGPQGSQQQQREHEIRELAYYKWEAAGRPPGDGRQFWEEAEKEVSRKK